MVIITEDLTREVDNVEVESVEIPTGYKMTELGLIPEDWETKKLSEISNIVRGGSPRPAGDPKYFNGNYIPWLTVAALTNIPDSELYVTKTVGCLTREGSRYSRSLEKGTLIIANSGATLGVAKILGVKCCANDGIAALINQDYGCSLFIAYYLNTKTGYLRDVVATGNGQPNLNTNLIGNLEIPFPHFQEQKAIAALLSDIDSLITNLNQLIAKKRYIKQAAMEQLLTGKRRLPGFSGEWKLKRLRDFCEVNKGTQINKSLLTNVGEYPVWNGGITPSGYTDNWNTKENTITISEGGNSCGFVNFCSQKFWCGGHCYSICQIKQNVYQLFLFQKLKQTQEVIMSLRVGSGLPNIQKKNLLNLEIKQPEDNKEQIAIANILSDMDTEITSLEQQLDKARNLKQGMMQELLTGRIRLI
jgi:type I restriction enzyme S subunit